MGKKDFGFIISDDVNTGDIITLEYDANVIENNKLVIYLNMIPNISQRSNSSASFVMKHDIKSHLNVHSCTHKYYVCPVTFTEKSHLK